MASNLGALLRYAAGPFLATCACLLSMQAYAIPKDKKNVQQTTQQTASRSYVSDETAEEDCLDDSGASVNNTSLTLRLSSSLPNLTGRGTQHLKEGNGEAKTLRPLLAALDAKDGKQKSVLAQDDSTKFTTASPQPLLVEPVTSATPRIWEIAMTDKTLNATLARWTSIAGWQLSWELPVDYAVEVRTSIPGSFEQAVETVAKSMDGAEIPMQAIFYNGNKVLRIIQRGAK